MLKTVVFLCQLKVVKSFFSFFFVNSSVLYLLGSLLKNTVFCWFLDKMVCIVVEGSFLKRFFCKFVFDIQSGDTVQSCFFALFRSYTHWWNQENFTKDTLKKETFFQNVFFVLPLVFWFQFSGENSRFCIDFSCFWM